MKDGPGDGGEAVAGVRETTVSIKAIVGGYVTVHLDPGQCLALADACHTHGDEESEQDRPERAAYFDLLRAAFEALALVAVAKCAMNREHGDAYDLAAIRRNYPVMPTPAKGGGA